MWWRGKKREVSGTLNTSSLGSILTSGGGVHVLIASLAIQGDARLGNFKPVFLWKYTYLWWLNTRANCVSRVKRATFRLNRVVRFIYRFVCRRLSDLSHTYCIGLRENYYNDFKVPAVQPSATVLFYALTPGVVVIVREKKKILCVSEVKQHSNKAWFFATRCCVDPDVIVTW